MPDHSKVLKVNVAFLPETQTVIMRIYEFNIEKGARDGFCIDAELTVEQTAELARMLNKTITKNEREPHAC